MAASRGVTDLRMSSMRIKYRTRERPSGKNVKLSIDNHIVGLVQKRHVVNEI